MAAVLPHDDATCQLCFWRNNVRCNICDYEAAPCDRSRFRGESYGVRIMRDGGVLFLCSGCDEYSDDALEQRVFELNQLRSVLLAQHRLFMSAFTTERRRVRTGHMETPISTHSVIHNPEDDYEDDFQQVEVSDPMDTLDFALDFIPAPSADFNNLLAAITSDPSLDPYPPE